MKLVLLVASLVNLALGVVLVMLSGMILQGVNHTGPIPGATLLLVAMVLCFAAPLAVWMLWGRLPGLGALAVLAAPPALTVLAFAIGG